jgi:hypothetical protein
LPLPLEPLQLLDDSPLVHSPIRSRYNQWHSWKYMVYKVHKMPLYTVWINLNFWNSEKGRQSLEEKVLEITSLFRMYHCCSVRSGPYGNTHTKFFSFSVALTRL